MEQQINSLKKVQKIQTLIILLLIVAIIWVYLNPRNQELKSNEIIHSKGIVIHDNEGNPRMAIGFPVTNEVRVRKDTLNGMVFLDDKGMDRIHLGPHGKLFLGGNYYNRTNNEGWSLFFNDPKGEERSGYGFSDSDNSIGLGMDYGGAHGGEAIYLYAAPQIAFMTINADLQDKQGIRDRIVLWHETDKDLSIAKISDAKKDGRIILKAENGSNPTIDYTDSLLNKVNIHKNHK
ncbi:hypothetical protein SAMN04487906_1932 [Zhouia amylolytica]|uniref:Uncharacterized protein n=1 Tax=Zhouia amylolytica TaxID=376730 RepID=A0A1I6TA01_9FLAO|nr:hypothetical protein [Zhouia amylolytica]SFS85958.1 hypothetical protein SAMN04487906_1932 [Zhouia amylolytica]